MKVDAVSNFRSRIFACLAVAALAAGCATSLPQQAGDPAGVIAVSNTDVGLAGRLNDTLDALGWRLISYQQGERAGLPPDDLPADLDNRARYRLELRAQEAGRCPSRGDHYIYDIRLIDNRSNNTVLRDQGRGCEIDVAEDFGAIMDQRGPQPSD